MRPLARLAVLAAALLAGAPAGAQPVSMLIGLSLPPYVIAAENRGLEYDIVSEALALRGRQMVPRYVDYGAVPVEMARGAADAAMTINPDSGVQACYSDVHIIYRDYAITLASRGLEIRRPADLAGRSVLAFQSAILYLGPDFAAMARTNPRYDEAADQAQQNYRLFAGEVEVIVADRRIFDWFNPAVAWRMDVTQPVVVHDIFAPLPYRVAFRDPALCASFIEGLAELRRSGRYEAILAAYGGG